MKERKFGRYLVTWLCISALVFSLIYASVIYVDRLGYESTILVNYYIRMSNPDVSKDGDQLCEYGILSEYPVSTTTYDPMANPEEQVLNFFIYNKLDKFLIKATRDLALFRTYNLKIMEKDNISIFDYDLYYLKDNLDKVEKHNTILSLYREGPWDDDFVLNGNYKGFELDQDYKTDDPKRVRYDFLESKKDMLFPDSLKEKERLEERAKEFNTELLFKEQSVPFNTIYNYPGENIMSYEISQFSSTELFRSGDYLISFCRNDYSDVTLVKVMIGRTIPYFEAESGYCLFAAVIVYSISIVIGLLFAIIRYRRNKYIFDLISYRNNLTDNLAHNFKTPLQIISGYAENIGDTDSPEDLKRYSEAITDKVAKMNESIESILLAAKRVEKKTVRNDVREIVDEISSKLDNMSRVKLVVEGDAVIKCDRIILTNILTNLLDNASRYAPEGTEVKVSLNGRRVTVTNPVKNEMFVPGIGLTVAMRMAENIRMTLTMKNDGKIFTAVLK